MSNYITVRNGILKREVPATPISVGFTNSKGLKYITTLDNGRARERVEFFGIPVTGATEFNSEGFDSARARDIEVIYDTPILYTGITTEQIREAIQYVYAQTEGNPGRSGDTFTITLNNSSENPLSLLSITNNPVLDGDNWTYELDTVDISPDERLRRGLITDIEYLDIISREDDNI